MASQLITPNPQIPCTPGMCLVYVREAFGISPKYPSAIAGWGASAHKHEDQNFPENVWVPVWFTLSDNVHGHVALRQPDGRVWSSSSPTSTTPIQYSSLDDLLSYYGGRLTYLGWTEDIEDMLVIDVSVSVQSVKAGTVVTHRLPGPISSSSTTRRLSRSVQVIDVSAGVDAVDLDEATPTPRLNEMERTFPHED